MTDRKPDIITQWKIKKNEDNSNCEGEWVATCSAYPNIKICGDDPDDIVFAIKKKLSELYEQHMGYYDGGITGYTADVRLYLAREKSLDYFSTNVEGSKDTNDTKDTDAVRAKLLDLGKQLLNSEDGLRALDNGGVTICLDEMPSDDPTPEPATDAPELHEPSEDKPYKWRRINTLDAGCAHCEQLRSGTCHGNKSGAVCNNYQCRRDSGSECRDCKNRGGKLGYQQGGKDAYMCDHHKQPICLDDFCCYAYKGR